MSIFIEPLAEYIWDIKYRYRHQGNIIDHTIEDTWMRVATCVARAEKHDKKLWQRKFFDLLANFRFLPGGRILAGANTQNQVTLFNCFVMGQLEDSLTGIFNALKQGALTLQQGGGVGYDFSTLRPRGAFAKHSGATASGPVSFMRIWDSMCATIQSSGLRRGAMMGILRCDHPDIEEFVSAKADPTQLRHFNVSVLVTDEFMDAVAKNKSWPLVFPVNENDKSNDANVIFRRWSGQADEVACRIYRQIRAKDLWDRIIRSAYDYAEPGVLFEDTINRMNNLYYREWISATNPCGEIPLPAYGACNLGSINLTQFVLHPFTENARMNWVGIETTAEMASRFLDNVIDVSHYPLLAQKRESQMTRRIGLGFTGLADALVMLGVRYASEQSIKLIKRIMKTICLSSWQTSIELAKQKKSFPIFEKKSYLQGHFVRTLPKELLREIARYGIRNSHHNAIAPTGTISILANNVSNGIEPIFSNQYSRRIRKADDTFESVQVTDYAYRLWQQTKPATEFPPAWIDVQALTPTDHLTIQAAVQSYVDGAISKTINTPAQTPFDEFKEIYTRAYKLGFKGCTVFRPNPVTGSILSTPVKGQKEPPCCNLEEEDEVR